MEAAYLEPPLRLTTPLPALGNHAEHVKILQRGAAAGRDRLPVLLAEVRRAAAFEHAPHLQRSSHVSAAAR